MRLLRQARQALHPLGRGLLIAGIQKNRAAVFQNGGPILCLLPHGARSVRRTELQFSTMAWTASMMSTAPERATRETGSPSTTARQCSPSQRQEIALTAYLDNHAVPQVAVGP